MVYDGNIQDYTKVKAPQKVYDRDNPPTRMSEAIRMAVADVEAQEAAGIEYEWGNCARCTAGAIIRRMGGSHWGDFGPKWKEILRCLSVLTAGWFKGFRFEGVFSKDTVSCNYVKAFASEPPSLVFGLTRYEDDPAAFKRDMLALADRLEAEGS